MTEPRLHPDAASALERGDDAAVHAWFQETLRSGSNPNLPLADGLLLEERFYLGPCPLELELLVRCCGPEPGIAYHDPSEDWQRHVDGLAGLITEGFRMPLLASSAGLVLMDGNHRAAAARQAGLTRFPTIIMFASAQERAQWVARYQAGELAQPLAGGHVTDVVQIGDTVRRVTKDRSPFVWQLLAQLEQARFTGAPRFVGVDGAGREALSFVAGAVHPRGAHSPAQVMSAAALLRQLHDQTAAWTDEGEVVLHGDPKPRNTVFQGEQAAAFIDFDSARPGPRSEDVGYLAWQFALNSYVDESQIPQQRALLAAVSDGYRPATPERLLDWVDEAQQRTLQHARSQDTVNWARREQQWLARHRAALTLS